MKFLISLALAIFAASVLSTDARAQGCTGGRASYNVRETVRVTAANLPHPVRGTIHWLQDHRPHPLASTGCSGFSATSTGCGGGGFSVTRTYSRMPIGPAPVVAMAPAPGQLVGGPLLDKLVTRRVMHRVLDGKGLTPAQATQVRAVLADPVKGAAAKTALANPLVLARVSDDFHGQMSQKFAADGRVGVIGDGHIIDAIIANLPAIIDAILKIINALSWEQFLEMLRQEAFVWEWPDYTLAA